MLLHGVTACCGSLIRTRQSLTLLMVSSTMLLLLLLLVTGTFFPDVLQWLPMPQRIRFKIAALAFDCVRSTSPVYFSHVVHAVADICGRSRLCSAVRGDLFVP